MISETEIEKALDYLRDDAEEASLARANRIYIEEFRKTIKAQIMGEHKDLPVSAQEREAYADPRYIAHLEAIRQAVHEDEKHRFWMKAAEAKIDAYRTQEASRRSMKL